MKTNLKPTFTQQQKQYDKYAHVPKDYMRIAEGMESQFNQLMLAQMKKTVDRANPSSPANRIYEQMLDEHYADIMASSDGTGIKDMVLEQIYPGFKKTHQKEAAINQYQNQMKGNGHEHN